jgi:hypothetical protein
MAFRIYKEDIPSVGRPRLLLAGYDALNTFTASQMLTRAVDAECRRLPEGIVAPLRRVPDPKNPTGWIMCRILTAVDDTPLCVIYGLWEDDEDDEEPDSVGVHLTP